LRTRVMSSERYYDTKNMKTARTVYVKILAVVIALSFAASVHAETAREEIAHAYKLLKSADRAYGGHRTNAIHELEVAAADIGLDLGGAAGPGHELQWKSDEKVSEAQKLLRDARIKLEARDRDRVTAHLQKAIEELNAALEAN
jgi:hypothetical protein